MREADYVVLAVPSQSLRDNLRQWQIPETAIVGWQKESSWQRVADERGGGRSR
jgi:hypothetical protein